MENHTIVTLKKGEGRTIKAGGAWIFDNEIDTIVGTFTNGDVVTVHDFDGYPMRKGFINQNSKIRIPPVIMPSYLPLKMPIFSS